MTLAASLIQELDTEAVATKRLLERIPEAQLGWKPAPKSRTLGELALHIAETPGAVASLAVSNPAQAPSFDSLNRSPNTCAEIATALELSLANARATLGAWTDQALMETWHLKAGDRELMAVPRIAFLRSIMLNHWYHHRGQLSVYLRELGVPLPSIYGPTADENPFQRS
jgi:uncharacterized damage-inducible protein DinB